MTVRSKKLTSPVPPADEEITDMTEETPTEDATPAVRRGAPVSLLAKAGREFETANRKYDRVVAKRDKLADALGEVQGELDALIASRDAAREMLEKALADAS